MHVMSPEGCDCDAKSADVEGLGFPDFLLSPNESTPSDIGSTKESHDASQNTTNDTQELLHESQLSEAKEKQTENLAESSQEEDAFTPSEEHRATDLFYALRVPDLFMKRVNKNGEWSLFCPNKAPGLSDCWGEEFEELYTRYEREVE